jgi:hypothetical protein
MFACPSFRFLSAAILVLWVGPFAGSTSTLTVHNQTDRTIAVSPGLRAWLLEPGPVLPEEAGGCRCAGPSTPATECRCLAPGTTTTFRLQDPDKDLDTALFIRRLPGDGLVQHEGLVIWAVDPDSSCLPCASSEPEAEVSECPPIEDHGSEPGISTEEPVLRARTL